MLDADFFRRWMTATAASVDREAERLTALDSPIGDADHGSNLQRGFRAVTATLEKEAPETPGAVLTLAGRQLISTVGGASGPLYGTLLRRTGKALGDAAEVGESEFAEALRAGVDAVMTLGGAAPGDKTMIDALVPAAVGAAARLRGAPGAAAPGALRLRSLRVRVRVVRRPRTSRWGSPRPCPAAPGPPRPPSPRRRPRPC